eukprot:5659654-Prymnesium_polylepis.1
MAPCERALRPPPSEHVSGLLLLARSPARRSDVRGRSRAAMAGPSACCGSALRWSSSCRPRTGVPPHAATLPPHVHVPCPMSMSTRPPRAHMPRRARPLAVRQGRRPVDRLPRATPLCGLVRRRLPRQHRRLAPDEADERHDAQDDDDGAQRRARPLL